MMTRKFFNPKTGRFFIFQIIFLLVFAVSFDGGILAEDQSAVPPELPGGFPMPGAAPAAPGPVLSIKEKLQKTIFLDLRDINVVDVFKFLAVQGNLNIVTSKNVQGRSTLVLNRVSIQDALDILVISNQLAYEIKGDIIYIMTEDEYLQMYGKNFNDKRKVLTRYLKYAKPAYALTTLQAIQSGVGKIVIDEDSGAVVMIDTNEKLLQMNSVLDEMEGKSDTEVVELQYAEAKGLEAQLKAQIDAKGVGSVYADERSNQLVVNAYSDRMKQILPVVKALDKREKAVLIEARILQLTLNPKFDMGINWTKVFRDLSNNELFRNVNLQQSFPIDTTVSTAGSLSSIGIGQVDPGEFEIAMKAMKEVQNTKTLANPRMMVLNRQAAKINIGDRIPYVVTTSTGSGANVSVSEDIRFIDVGVILEVTPVISDNGFITMKIRPEISSQINTLTTPTDNKIPIVNKTFIESSVIVQDGVSVILGGLRRDELSENNKGVPFLMDIPYLGNAFKSRNESMIKTEIVIIITPKIVTGEKDILDQPIGIKDPMPTKVSLNASGPHTKNIFASSRNTAAIGESTGSSAGSQAELQPAEKRQIEPILMPDMDISTIQQGPFGIKRTKES